MRKRDPNKACISAKLICQLLTERCPIRTLAVGCTKDRFRNNDRLRPAYRMTSTRSARRALPPSMLAWFDGRPVDSGARPARTSFVRPSDL